ncbi:MAG: hypothetical protein AAGH64_13055, partial [Planctomycetota bacterium]
MHHSTRPDPTLMAFDNDFPEQATSRDDEHTPSGSGVGGGSDLISGAANQTTSTEFYSPIPEGYRR